MVALVHFSFRNDELCAAGPFLGFIGMSANPLVRPPQMLWQSGGSLRQIPTISHLLYCLQHYYNYYQRNSIFLLKKTTTRVQYILQLLSFLLRRPAALAPTILVLQHLIHRHVKITWLHRIVHSSNINELVGPPRSKKSCYFDGYYKYSMEPGFPHYMHSRYRLGVYFWIILDAKCKL